MNIEKELKKTEEQIDILMQNLANKVSDKYIIPFCKKYKIKFISGMGTYFFTNIKTNEILYPEQIIKSKKQEKLIEILNILDKLVLNINGDLSGYINNFE